MNNSIITLVDKTTGYPIILEVLRWNKNYVEGIQLWKEGATIKRLSEIKRIKTAGHVILKGARWDLVDLYMKWLYEAEVYNERRRTYLSDLLIQYIQNNETESWVREKIEEWDRLNPEPKNPILTMIRSHKL